MWLLMYDILIQPWAFKPQQVYAALQFAAESGIELETRTDPQGREHWIVKQGYKYGPGLLD